MDFGGGLMPVISVVTSAYDAALIARFYAAIKPALWQPTAPEIKELQALVPIVN
jgi:hypothetical protein